MFFPSDSTHTERMWALDVPRAGSGARGKAVNFKNYVGRSFIAVAARSRSY